MKDMKLPHATEVAYAIDTTGSMAPCKANVFKHVEKTCEELFNDIPDLKIGFIFHGDYCDGDSCYKILPLTNDKAKIFDFIRNAPNTSGGDVPECYELVLNLAQGLGWSDAKGGKILVMIGDASPHDVNYPGNKDHLDWKKEAAILKERGIDVFAIQCLYRQHATEANNFWQALTENAGTPLMKLDDFSEATTNIRAVAAASAGEVTYANYTSSIEMCSLSDSSVKNIESLKSVAARYNKVEPEKKDK